MRRRSWSSELLILAWSACLPACNGCHAPADAGASSPSASVAATVSAPPVTSASVAVDAGARDAEADGATTTVNAGHDSDAGPDFAAGQCPSFDPVRWTLYEPTPAVPGCVMMRPDGKDKLPPISWEPCAREGFGGRCRRLKLAPGETLSFRQGERRQADAHGQGPGRLQVVLGCAPLDWFVYVVADLDGPTTGALELDSSWRCRLQPTLRRSGWGAELQFNVDPDSEQSEIVSLTAARMQLVPTMAKGALPDETAREAKELTAWRRTPRDEAVVTAMGFKGLKDRSLSMATDGTDVVWSTTARSTSQEKACQVFTGRWVEHPRDVAATHVVDLPCMETSNAWKVACGFAATQTDEGQTLLLRLADGTAYRFPKLSAALDDNWGANTTPLDVSCKEVVLAVGGASPNVFRVPLDALPAGTPPPEPPTHLGGASDGGTTSTPTATVDAGANR
jgi:hypothetical protein